MSVSELVDRLGTFAMSDEAAEQLAWTNGEHEPPDLVVAVRYGSIQQLPSKRRTRQRRARTTLLGYFVTRH